MLLSCEQEAKNRKYYEKRLLLHESSKSHMPRRWLKLRRLPGASSSLSLPVHPPNQFGNLSSLGANLLSQASTFLADTSGQENGDSA
jgi:hypothetical protein